MNEKIEIDANPYIMEDCSQLTGMVMLKRPEEACSRKRSSKQ